MQMYGSVFIRIFPSYHPSTGTFPTLDLGLWTFFIPHSALRTGLLCALKTGYTVTLLTINNLRGYKSVTPQLHGYIVIHQQLSSPKIGNRPATFLEFCSSAVGATSL
jgi:hypothetical protein